MENLLQLQRLFTYNLIKYLKVIATSTLFELSNKQEAIPNGKRFIDLNVNLI